MKTTRIQFVSALGLFALGALFILYCALSRPSTASANVLAYAVPKVATSGTVSVGPQATTVLAATSSNCTSRVVTTVANPVMLTFNDAAPTGVYGHLQPASTTAVYENADYGCGSIRAYGFTASTSITVTQLTQ